jgi:tetratricopeptide (TPR) repeat protein
LKRSLTLAAIMLAFALPTAALAQKGSAKTHKPSAKQVRDAKRLFNKAHLAYRRGDYEEAIIKWEQAYELSHKPLIFLSIANAYERLGRAKDALENLKKWREHADKYEHKELDGRIEGLEQRVTDDEAKLKDEQKEDAKRTNEEDKRRTAAVDAERRRMEGESDSSEADLWTIVGWSAIGTGAAAVVAGLIIDGVAASTRPSEDEACTDSDGQLLCREDLRDDIESSNTLAIAGDITWIAGSVIAAAGVVALFTLAGSEGDDGGPIVALRVLPIVAPNAGGLLLTTTF